MLRRHRWLRCALVGAIIVLPPSMAFAQEDPFGDVAPGGPESGVPAAAAAPASEKLLQAVELPDLKTRKDQDFCRCIGESDSEAVARIESVLNNPLGTNGIDFTETPLEEVVNLLQDEYGIPFQIDEAALEATGLDPTEKITANLHNISLRSALRLMLKRLQLTYIIADEVLVITTPEEADANLVTCVYDVRDILVDSSTKSMDELVDTIGSCVDTESWDGSEGKVKTLKPGLLVVLHNEDMQQKIKSLLKAIREMRGDDTGGDRARLGAEEVETRLYALKVNGNPEKLGDQVRGMIIQSIADAQWEGQLPDGQSVMISVLADRIVVRQKPSVQDKVATLLKDSGVAAPARPSEINRGRGGGTQKGDGEGGLVAPTVHEPRVSE